MPIPEIPAEVLAEAYRLSYHGAAKHVWCEAWQACTSTYEAAIETSVSNQIDAYWTNIYNLLDDETSPMWLAFADVVEKLQPDIGPWDKRELVSAIVAEFKAVIEDVD